MDLSALARACTGGLATQFWQTTILFAVVGLIALLLRNASARVRYALWVIVLVRFAIPPITIPWPGAAPMHAALTLPLSLFRAPDILRIPAALRPPSSLDATEEESGSAPREAASPHAPAAHPPDVAAGTPGLVEIAFLAWGAGVLFLLGALCAQAVRLRRMIRSADPAPADLALAFDAIRRALGIRRPVSLRVASGIASPVAVGVLRPVVLFPAHLIGALEACDREAVFLHELVHIRRWDLAIHWLATLVRIVYFFHPVAWIAFARIRIDRELATDESALLGEGKDFMAYGRTLIKVASLAPRAAAAGATSLALSEAARDIKRRLIRIKHARVPRARWWPVAPAAAALLALIASCANPTDTGDAKAPAAGSSTSSQPPAVAEASPPDNRGDTDVLQDFAGALSAGDRARLDPYIEIDDDLEREFVAATAAALGDATSIDGGPKVLLTSSKRLSGERLFACFLLRVRGDGLFSNGPTPMPLLFRREQGRWRTRWWSPRTIIDAKEHAPAQIGRRAVAQMIASLRFGDLPRAEWFAYRQAQNEAFAALADPPYNLEMFKALKGQPSEADAMEGLIDLPWPEFEQRILGDMESETLPTPDDFVLAFYLEAREGRRSREIPLADGTGNFTAEVLPCLFELGIARAQVSLDPGTSAPQISVEFTKPAAKLFERITSESIGKKIAIVVDGKVVSAPAIRERVSGRAVISGRFTPEEARRIADRLNAYRTRLRELLDTIRDDRAKPKPEKTAAKAEASEVGP